MRIRCGSRTATTPPVDPTGTVGPTDSAFEANLPSDPSGLSLALEEGGESGAPCQISLVNQGANAIYVYGWNSWGRDKLAPRAQVRRTPRAEPPPRVRMRR